MSEPEIDSDKPDTESMFDFLAEEEEGGKVRRKSAKDDSERPLPVIRKPVPVSQSGPLLPPKPGSPVEPPPPITDATAASVEDDFDFLNDLDAESKSRPSPSQSEKRAVRSQGKTSVTGNVTRFPSRPASSAVKGSRLQQQADARPAAADLYGDSEQRATEPGKRSRRMVDLDEFDLEPIDEDHFPADWHDGIRPDRIAANDGSSKSRYRWLLAAVVLIAAGIGSFLYTSTPTWLAERIPMSVDSTTSNAGSSANGSTAFNTASEDPGTQSTFQNIAGEGDDAASVAAPREPVFSPLMQQFKDQLSRIEKLVEEGSLDEAETAIATMDRTVYGYGVYEFSELENRIAQIRSGAVDPASLESAAQQQAALAEQAAEEEQARLAEQAAQEQAAREEQVRLAEQAAQEQAAREEQARLAEQAAQEQAAREEQARLAEQAAQKQAAREEQARLAEQAAQEQAAREEQARLAEQAAQEQAAREEQARLAEEARVAEAERLEAARVEEAMRAARAAQALVARQEQARLAEQARQAALSQSGTQSGVDADRRATDRQIAEERAAAERQRARELRLIQAREREQARLAQQQSAATSSSAQTSTSTVAAEETASVESAQLDEATSVEPIALATRAITDEDLQLVYRQFSNLQNAIRDRDINTVVALTQRSGVRVQQFMQMFENSVEIDARIRNVSTRNATGEIHGTLQINKIRRRDGIVTEPPVSLSSIPLTSRREGSGWSAISW